VRKIFVEVFSDGQLDNGVSKKLKTLIVLKVLLLVFVEIGAMNENSLVNWAILEGDADRFFKF
jgi:hypothetical protein